MIGERELRFYRLFSLRRDSKNFPHPLDRSRCCAASPMVVAPSNSAEILRNFPRSSCSVVIEIVNSSKREPKSARFGTSEVYCSASPSRRRISWHRQHQLRICRIKALCCGIPTSVVAWLPLPVRFTVSEHYPPLDGVQNTSKGRQSRDAGFVPLPPVPTLPTGITMHYREDQMQSGRRFGYGDREPLFTRTLEQLVRYRALSPESFCFGRPHMWLLHPDSSGQRPSRLYPRECSSFRATRNAESLKETLAR